MGTGWSQGPNEPWVQWKLQSHTKHSWTAEYGGFALWVAPSWNDSWVWRAAQPSKNGYDVPFTGTAKTEEAAKRAAIKAAMK